MSRRLWPVALVLVGCAWSESKYISRRAEADCAWALRCESAAVLAFRGWDTQEACLASHGPEVAGAGEGCAYDKRAAKPCVQAIEDSSCPAEGEDQVLPVTCDQVYTGCTGDTVDTADSGT